MFRKVLFPTDGSEHSIKAARYVIQLKQQYPQMEITQLFVLPDQPVLYNLGEYVVFDTVDRSADILRITSNLFHDAGIEVETLVANGQPAERIIELGNTYDLVVMGARGMMQESRGYLKNLRVWLGSVSRKVLHQIQKPVIIVKSGAGQHD